MIIMVIERLEEKKISGKYFNKDTCEKIFTAVIRLTAYSVVTHLQLSPSGTSKNLFSHRDFFFFLFIYFYCFMGSN